MDLAVNLTKAAAAIAIAGFTPWTVAGLVLPLSPLSLQWKPVLDSVQHIYNLAGVLKQSHHRDLRETMEDLDLQFHVCRVSEIVQRYMPKDIMDGSILVETLPNNYEEKVADDVNEILMKIIGDLDIIQRKERAYNKSWNYFAKLDLEDDLVRLTRRKKIMLDRLDILCEVVKPDLERVKSELYQEILVQLKLQNL
jgi:hypothetical protein